ncbi:PREDICTED: androglobin-like [Polistes dominula]|uniref:Androglobin-like n=1 Tax=Polistes dominula TaxID=743375 RepID=A0ABM1JET9_POLDO|nr:PREDICTED: androglobin-like [Polistes dominula]
MNLASREQKKKGSKKSSTTGVVHGDSIEFMNTYVWPRSMKSSRNEPLYLFCDSLEDKFFLINLSIMEKRLPFSSQVSNEEDVVDDSITIRLSSEDVSYLIVEKHSWFYRPTESRTLISISTSGSKSRVLELESGRHLLRIYCRSESHCFVSISSNTIFHVGDRFKIHRLMITESDRIDFLVKQISNSISTAFSSFGNINYVKNLMAFYRSYMPDLTNLTERRDRAFYKQIHDYFIEELLESIKMIFQSEDIPEMLSSLRIFFLDPMIGYERHKTPSIILNAFREINDDNDDDNDNESIIFKENYYSSESIDGEMATRIDYNQAATVIQSFFKMVIVKRYKQRHNINHKDHSKILTGLLKIAKLFDYSNGESLASSLIRKVIEKNQRFNEAYPCSEDFQYVLKIQECKGHLLNVKPNQWIPITRLIVNAKENETIFGTIQLFTNLSCHNLRLFENETGREMWRIVNNVAPSNYHYTTCGYTLFAYGWCDNPKLRDVEWIIHFVTIKGKSMFYQLTDKEPISLNTKIPNLIIEETFNTYIPNSMNLISKWIVNIVKDSVLSLRLMTSYELVQMKIRIVDNKENVLLEIEGRSILCIPVVYLKLEDSQTVYYIEAFVLDNSWPLTDAEWSVVLEKKTKRENLPVRNKSSISSSIRLIKRSETTRTRRSSKHQNDQHLDPPFWTLQAVIDADSGVEIIQDKRREEEIASLKESWSKDDPERPKRCKQLRETFLNAHALPPSTTSLNNLNNKISVKTNERMEKHKVRNSSKICRSSSSTENFAIRSLKEPKYRSFHLPKLDLSKYEKIEENGKERRTRTKSEEELLNDRLYADILEFNHSHDHFIQRLNDWSLKQITKYKQLWNIYEENSTQRKAQLEEAYEMRQDYISNVKSIDTSIKVKGGKKSVKR